MGGMQPGSNAKLIALLGWIFAPFGLIAIFLDDFKHDRFVRSHVIQAAAVSLVAWVVNFALSWTVIVPLVLGLGLFVLEIYMAIQAFNGKWVELPYVYGFVKNYIDEV